MVRVFLGRMLDAWHGINDSMRRDPKVKAFLAAAIQEGAPYRDVYPEGVLREFTKRTPLADRLRDAAAARTPLPGLLHDVLVHRPEAVVDAYAAVQKGLGASFLPQDRSHLERAIAGYQEALAPEKERVLDLDGIWKKRPYLFKPKEQGGFSDHEKTKIFEFYKEALKHGANPDSFLDHFEHITPEQMLSLDKDRKERLDNDELDVLLFRNPDLVFDVYEIYARRALEKLPNGKELVRKTVSDAREATIAYCERFKRPVKGLKPWETIDPPAAHKRQLERMGLPADAAKYSFISDFLQIARRKFGLPHLRDRLNLLGELRPTPRPFFQRIALAPDSPLRRKTRHWEHLHPHERYDSLPGAEFDLYDLNPGYLHKLIMEEPTKLSLAHRSVYGEYMRRTPGYRLRSFFDRLTGGRFNLTEDSDRKIKEGMVAGDRAIQAYRDYFQNAYDLNVSGNVSKLAHHDADGPSEIRERRLARKRRSKKPER